MTALHAHPHRRLGPHYVRWALGNIMVVAICVAGLGFSRLPTATLLTLILGAGLILGLLCLVRRGLKFIDVVSVVAVALFVVGFVVPAILQTKARPGARKTYPITISVKLHSLMLPNR